MTSVSNLALGFTSSGREDSRLTCAHPQVPSARPRASLSSVTAQWAEGFSRRGQQGHASALCCAPLPSQRLPLGPGSD